MKKRVESARNRPKTVHNTAITNTNKDLLATFWPTLKRVNPPTDHSAKGVSRNPIVAASSERYETVISSLAWRVVCHPDTKLLETVTSRPLKP